MGCVYESFVPGVGIAGWRRRYCGFVFAGAEPERMISGWTASRDSSKTEEGKPPGYGQIRSELRMSSKLKLSRILPLRG